MKYLVYFLFGDKELIEAAIQALGWMKGVRYIGDGWDNGTIERLERALTPYVSR